MPDNPYTPPARGGEPPTPADEGIAFNDYDLERVSRTTTWMRRVSSLQFIFGVLMLIGGGVLAAMAGAALSASAAVALELVSVGLNALVMLAGAVFLRQSCIAFYDGILANAESGLALGFRKLRVYLILYGAIGLLMLAVNVLPFVLMARR